MDVEELWSDVAHHGTEATPRPSKVNRILRVPSSGNPHVVNQAVGFPFAFGAGDDWFDAEGGQRTEHTARRRDWR